MDTFPSQTVKLTAGGSAPVATLTFGHINVGKFSIHVWDNTLQEWNTVFAKARVDDPDSFQFPGALSSWDGKIIRIDAWQESSIGGPDVQFSVTLTIEQDGATATNGIFPTSTQKDTQYQSFFKVI